MYTPIKLEVRLKATWPVFSSRNETMSGSVNFEKKHLAQCKYFSAYHFPCPGIATTRRITGRITKTEKVGPCTCTWTIASVASKQPVDVLRFDLKAVSVYRQILQFHCSKPLSMYNRVDKYEKGNVERMHDRGIKIASLNSNFFMKNFLKWK